MHRSAIGFITIVRLAMLCVLALAAHSLAAEKEEMVWTPPTSDGGRRVRQELPTAPLASGDRGTAGEQRRGQLDLGHPPSGG